MNAGRWMKRIAAGLVAIVAVTAFSGATYERAMRRRAIRDYPAPGRLVDVGGGRRIQIDCRGAGSPTVVLESGLDNYGSLAWAAVHDSLATTTRVCAYSRAGVMWSDPADGPLDGTAVARDLHAALVGSGESAPWVMVGHSLGGPYIMLFTKLYGTEVAGLVFVDPSHPDQLARFQEAAGKSMQVKPGVIRIGAALAWTGIFRLLPLPPPPSSWPPEVGREGAAFLPTTIAELLKEVEAIAPTLDAARTATHLGSRPLVVLTAGRPHGPNELRAMGVTPAQGARVQAASLRLHEEQATWSTVGRHELVPDASHYIQFDRPDVVIRVVRDVVAETRASGVTSRVNQGMLNE